jgi:hypothetical protein
VVDKRRVQRRIWQIQRVQTWQLVVLLILAAFVSATFLRLNNVGMVKIRTAVLAADSAGDNTKTQTRLYDLQRYVSAHMNTDLGKGVFLEATYNRDYGKLLAAASNDSNSNGNIYKKAQEVCAPQFSHYSSAYLQCTLNEINKYPASGTLTSSVSLSPNTYIHAFVSPLWSPDFAGWSLLVCVVILIMIITRLVSVMTLKFLLRHHNNSI